MPHNLPPHTHTHLNHKINLTINLIYESNHHSIITPAPGHSISTEQRPCRHAQLTEGCHGQHAAGRNTMDKRLLGRTIRDIPQRVDTIHVRDMEEQGRQGMEQLPRSIGEDRGRASRPGIPRWRHVQMV